MPAHQADLVTCKKQAGTTVARVCATCDGKCPSCDSHVRLVTEARICKDCSSGRSAFNCIFCGSYLLDKYDLENNPPPVARICVPCTLNEELAGDCAKTINLGSSRMDLAFQKKSKRP